MNSHDSFIGNLSMKEENIRFYELEESRQLLEFEIVNNNYTSVHSMEFIEQSVEKHIDRLLASLGIVMIEKYTLATVIEELNTNEKGKLKFVLIGKMKVIGVEKAQMLTGL